MRFKPYEMCVSVCCSRSQRLRIDAFYGISFGFLMNRFCFAFIFTFVFPFLLILLLKINIRRESATVIVVVRFTHSLFLSRALVCCVRALTFSFVYREKRSMAIKRAHTQQMYVVHTHNGWNTLTRRRF